MNKQALETIAQAMVTDGKGILAADESTGTIKKRFDSINVDSTEDNRRDYREMLFRRKTPCASIFPVSFCLMKPCAKRLPTATGASYRDTGALPGIKVDAGAKPMAGHDGEMVTEGLDGLRDRLNEYHALGAKFAKWRAVINIADGLPSAACLTANTHALARYARCVRRPKLFRLSSRKSLWMAPHG